MLFLVKDIYRIYKNKEDYKVEERSSRPDEWNKIIPVEDITKSLTDDVIFSTYQKPVFNKEQKNMIVKNRYIYNLYTFTTNEPAHHLGGTN